MASDVTVFVPFDDRARPLSADEALEAVRAAHPRWAVARFGPRAFAVGLYGRTPVRVARAGGPFVSEESGEMADVVLARTGDAALADRVRGANARFEVHWDAGDDDDLVPETGGVVVECARLLARLTGGAALVGGSRPIPENADPDAAVDLLFPRG